MVSLNNINGLLGNKCHKIKIKRILCYIQIKDALMVYTVILKNDIKSMVYGLHREYCHPGILLRQQYHYLQC